MALRGSSSYDKEAERLTASLFVETVIAGDPIPSKDSSRQRSLNDKSKIHGKAVQYRDSMDRIGHLTEISISSNREFKYDSQSTDKIGTRMDREEGLQSLAGHTDTPEFQEDRFTAIAEGAWSDRSKHPRQTAGAFFSLDTESETDTRKFGIISAQSTPKGGKRGRDDLAGSSDKRKGKKGRIQDDPIIMIDSS